MANTRKSASTDHLFQRFGEQHSAALVPGRRVVVGYSGGLDSTVLLHLLVRAREAAAFPLSAFHVHHGLSAHADAWLRHCEQCCAAWGVPFAHICVDVNDAAGGGIETRARNARYGAFETLAADTVALAHHRDDQAETVLYRLLRGAGVHGASGMPAVRALQSGARIWRPLLQEGRDDLLAYAHTHALRWVEDDSNVCEDFDRNFLRQRVMPELATRFPAASRTLARAAAHFADSAYLLDELARSDAGGLPGPRLAVVRLSALDDARRRNLLRWFLAQRGLRLDTSQLRTILAQLLDAGSDTSPCLRLGEYEVHRYRGEIWVSRSVRAAPAAAVASLAEAGRAAGWLGTLLWQQRDEAIAPSMIERLVMRPRSGGEALRTRPAGPVRTVKNLFQEAGVPPWMRGAWPLLWDGERLVAVASIAVAADAQSAGGMWPVWRADDWPDGP